MNAFKIRAPNIDNICVRDGIFTKCTGKENIVEFKAKIIPAFSDTHTHLSEYGLSLSFPQISGINRRADVADFVNAFIQKTQREFYIFTDFDESEWDKKKWFTREELDKIESDRPVILRRVCGHVALLNSAAIDYFRKKGIETSDSPAYETIPLNILSYFNFKIEDYKDAILKAQKLYLSLGVSSICEFAKSQTVFEAYKSLEQEGKLKLKVFISFYYNNFELMQQAGMKTYEGGEKVHIGALKLFLDGSIGAETAAFNEHYKSGKIAHTFYTQNELASIIKEADAQGIQLAMHAIGTSAIKLALSSIPLNLNIPPRIEHFEFPDHESIKMAGEKSVLISMQPNFVRRWFSMYKSRLSSDVLKRCNPFRTLFDRGLKLSFGSDAMPPGPLYGIKGATNHPLDKERLTEKEALKLYTEAGEHFTGFKTGKLAPGYSADFIALAEFNGSKYPKSLFIDGQKIF